jgi:DNA-binding transcriptional LysR family regulator
LTSPLLATVVFFALSWRFSEFPIVMTDDKTSLLLQAIAAGLGGGFLEEFPAVAGHIQLVQTFERDVQDSDDP